MKFSNTKEYELYQNLTDKKAILILGYTLGVKACQKSLCTIFELSNRDLEVFKVLKEQEQKTID